MKVGVAIDNTYLRGYETNHVRAFVGPYPQ